MEDMTVEELIKELIDCTEQSLKSLRLLELDELTRCKLYIRDGGMPKSMHAILCSAGNGLQGSIEHIDELLTREEVLNDFELPSEEEIPKWN